MRDKGSQEKKAASAIEESCLRDARGFLSIDKRLITNRLGKNIIVAGTVKPGNFK
jgi:hypothetical protein